MTTDKLRIAYLTAGAAGMFCGSCLNDNAVAKELLSRGHDTILTPVYTPIRTDAEDVSIDQVFLGGVNVYLAQKLPLLNYLPSWVDKLLNHPKLIALATKNAGKTSPELLGELTSSMLQGTQGRQRKEFQRLIDWLGKDIQPDIVVFTNLLIGGCIPNLKAHSKAKVVVTLQGDDIFLDSLPTKYKKPVLQSMRALVPHVDAFVVHSRDYADRMQELLGIPDSQLAVIPLGISTDEFRSSDSAPASASPYTIGYLARLAPEKGLHRLIDAFIRVANEPECAHARLKLAGWLGPQHSEYWQQQRAKLAEAGLADRWEYAGVIDLEEKRSFLKSIDLFCVPTTYLEPKGLFLLEAVASGVPYLQPNHGAFTELHQRISNLAGNQFVGELFEPSNAPAASASASMESPHDDGSPNIFSAAAVGPGHLEMKLRQAIARGRSRYTVPTPLLEEIGMDKHADRFLALLQSLQAQS